jgi:hypothetical protein
LIYVHGKKLLFVNTVAEYWWMLIWLKKKNNITFQCNYFTIFD